jgi:hypothetical protein
MIGGEWKRAGGDRQSPLLVRFRLYRTPVGVISGLILFRLVAFWGTVNDGLVRPFFVGRVLVEGPLLAVRRLVVQGGSTALEQLTKKLGFFC